MSVSPIPVFMSAENFHSPMISYENHNSVLILQAIESSLSTFLSNYFLNRLLAYSDYKPYTMTIYPVLY